MQHLIEVLRKSISLLFQYYVLRSCKLQGYLIALLRESKVHITFVFILILLWLFIGALGGVVVKALRYKPAGRGFDSRWCHWNFSVT